MDYNEEIEDLEERLSLYRRNIGRNNVREAFLTQKIKRMEEQLKLFKKAQVFDEIVDAMNSSLNPGLNGNPYIDSIDFAIKAGYIIRKYESECESND